MESLNMQLQPFFQWLLRTTLQASLLICLILFFQTVLRSRLGARWHNCLWLLLFIRLAIPWAPQSRLSIFNLIPQSITQQQTEYARQEIIDDTTVSEPKSPSTTKPKRTLTTTVQQDSPKAITTAAQIHKEAKGRPRPVFSRFAEILPLIWLSGALVLAVYVTACNFRLWRLVTRERPLTDQSILDLLEDCKSQMGIRTILGVVITDKVRSPALFGFVRPRLLLPAGIIENLNLKELRHVFFHELAHLKRHDIYIGYLCSLLQVLHWFNPLVWLAFYRIRTDRELACDALVLAQTHSSESKDYGRTIVSLLERFSLSQRLPAMAGIMETKSQLKRRITMIAKFKKNSYKLSSLSIIMIIILACISLPDAISTRASGISDEALALPISLRRVWSGPEVDAYGKVSSDGQYLSYTDWETGDLAIRELATGKTQRLTETKKGGREKFFRFALNSVISPDGKLIAYSWTNQHGTYDLCVIGTDGSGDRTLYSSKDHELYPACWSSDGKQIAARKFTSKGGYLEIISFSVADGSVQVLKTSEEIFWPQFCYSPNDQYLVFDFPAEGKSENYDISLILTNGKGEIPLIKHPAQDRLLGWAPHHEDVLFLSNRTGTYDIWAIKVVDNKPQGSPRPIARDIGQISPQGFTQDGSFYFSRYTRRFTTYIVPFDRDTGEIKDEFKSPLLGSNFDAEWSPDGRYLAYIKEQTRPQGPGYYHRPLHIRNVKTGKEQILASDFTVRAPRWSPNGHTILVTGKNRRKDGQLDYNGGIYKIDVQDGTVTELVRFPPVEVWSRDIWTKSVSEWASDGNMFFYTNRCRIIRGGLESGREKQLYQNDNLQRVLRLSPDGKRLLVSTRNRDEGTGSILIMPVSGGEITKLCKFHEKQGGIPVPGSVNWTPDGNYILFAKSEKKGSTVWRISPEDGEPEVIWKSKDRVTDLSVHPNGEKIAVSTYFQEQSTWLMENFLPEMSVAKPFHQPKFTKIRIPNRMSWDAQLTPDGTSITLVNDKRIWIVPRSSRLGPGYPGAPKLLDTAGVEADWCGFTWSADGRWIAFNGKEVEEGCQQIYVVSADGGKPKQVHKNNREVRVVNYRMSLSTHGETLAFTSVDANELHIYSLPVKGGLPKRLVEARAREPVFSPDGTMIAYVEDKALGRAGGGLWVVPADSGTPKLVAEAGNASSPLWSPDGTMLAFVDYTAAKQIHIVQLTQEGNPAGEKITIDCPEGINGVRRLAGWTPDNQIGAILAAEIEFALYTQPVQGGKATFVTHAGGPGQPRWSPDGKRVYHTNKTDATSGDWQSHAIAYVSAEGGDVTTVPLHSEPKIRLQGYGTGNHISPDGTTIVFAGHKAGAPIPTMNIWTLSIDGGIPRQLTDAPLPFRDWYPCWSPDGQNIAFVRMKAAENWAVTGKGNIYIVSADGGEPRQITSESDRVFDAGPVLWSPDGTLLAYFSRDKDDAADGTLKVIPPDGGKPQIVAKVKRIYANKEMAWSPDSRRIAYNAPGNKIKIVSLDDGNLVEIEPDLKNVNIYHIDWSPDGESFVFGGYTGGGPEFWVMENFLPRVVSKAK